MGRKNKNIIKCPNCGKDIKLTDEYRECGWEWGEDCEGLYHLVTVGECKDCKIKYYNAEWKIPEELKPTVKQCRTVRFIENRLDARLHDDIGLKKRYWQFISQYFEEAKKIELEPYNDYEDYYDYGYDESWFF